MSQRSNSVLHLPPVRICFELCLRYFSEVAPKIQSKSYWLPNKVACELEKEVIPMWEAYGRSQVMYSYVSHLEEAAESAFKLGRLEIASNVLHHLLDYDRDAKQPAFEQSTYECGVCLNPKKGSSCHQMENCRHVFCIECLQAYYHDAILTGNINNVKCPAFNCGDRHARRVMLVTPRQLLRIPIERPMAQRYVNLKRKKKLESDRTAIWCPRQWYQGAAKGNNYPTLNLPLDDMGVVFEDNDIPSHQEEQADQDEDEGNSVKEAAFLASRLQICEDCSYAFCRHCKHSWHGDFFDCRARTILHPERSLAEIEDDASLDFIRHNTSKCPKCETSIQKSEACNHMTCAQCRTHFCYLCSAFLSSVHPYAHFNKPGSICHQRLWEGGNGEGVER